MCSDQLSSAESSTIDTVAAAESMEVDYLSNLVITVGAYSSNTEVGCKSLVRLYICFRLGESVQYVHHKSMEIKQVYDVYEQKRIGTIMGHFFFLHKVVGL